MKKTLQTNAIELRRQGLTYSEILKQIPVAKSTLSLWLRSVQMAKQQEQRYTEKKRLAGIRGGLARKTERIQRQELIMNLARAEISEISDRELWLMGIVLYWAEGTKEKIYRTGHTVVFTNSDSKMISVFLQWVEICLKIPREDVYFNLHIHDTHRSRVNEHIAFWNKVIGMRYNSLEKVYFKKHNPSPKRKNLNQSYHGQLNVKIRNSVDLNRKIAGWVEGICHICPVV
ncbi:MAG: hypothetical protein ABI758_00045 [Candidatus Woesebacteria bacterium]